MANNFDQKLRKHISKSRKIPLSAIKAGNIDQFLSKLSDIRWRPDYLFKDTNSKKYIAFTIIYDAESPPNNLSQEVEKAMQHCNFDFFFILENEPLLNIFEEECREKGFGLILYKREMPLLVRDAIRPIIPKKTLDHHVGHYPLWVINEIREIKLGNSKFRTALKDFSNGYNRLEKRKALDWQKEEKLVKNTIIEILKSDTRYTSGVDSLQILRRFESPFSDIRDHYFHSFHIFLLGLLILDHDKGEFTEYYKRVFPRYQNFSIEFLWLLTSIFHDVGYPIERLNSLKENIYGVSGLPSERETTNVWDDPTYKENLKQLISLFRFSLSEKKHRTDWPHEIFGTTDDQLEQTFRESFYDSHGVAGCFRFLVDIFSEAKQERSHEKKTFLANHIYPAAISIALHDKRFRDRLLDIDVKKIKLSRFPFAVLLMYLDTLQEDKRDRFLCIEDPELLQGFEYNGKVVAIIDKELAASYRHLGKWKVECRDFINFVGCDGVKFEFPKILL